MTKILNLDEVSPQAEKVIKLNGKEHLLAPITVGEFIRVTREAEAIDAKQVKGKPQKISEQFEYFIQTITRSFPTITEEELKDMDLSKLKYIVDFIHSEVEVEAEAAEGAGVKK